MLEESNIDANRCAHITTVYRVCVLLYENIINLCLLVIVCVNQKKLGMYRISGSGWPDIRPFFNIPVLLKGEGVEFNAPPDTIQVISEAENGTKYRISQPDSDRSFLAVHL